MPLSKAPLVLPGILLATKNAHEGTPHQLVNPTIKCYRHVSWNNTNLTNEYLRKVQR